MLGALSVRVIHGTDRDDTCVLACTEGVGGADASVVAATAGIACPSEGDGEARRRGGGASERELAWVSGCFGGVGIIGNDGNGAAVIVPDQDSDRIRASDRVSGISGDSHINGLSSFIGSIIHRNERQRDLRLTGRNEDRGAGIRKVGADFR